MIDLFGGYIIAMLIIVMLILLVWLHYCYAAFIVNRYKINRSGGRKSQPEWEKSSFGCDFGEKLESLMLLSIH